MKNESAVSSFETTCIRFRRFSKPSTNATSIGFILGAETAPEIALLGQDDELPYDP